MNEPFSDLSLDYIHELDAVNELAEALTLGQGVDAVIETALNRMIALMKMDVGAIYLFEKGSSTLKLKASQGFFTSELLQAMASVEQGTSFTECLIKTGHAIAVENGRRVLGMSPLLAELVSRNGFISWTCASLKMEGEIIGTYHLGKHNWRAFTTHDIALLEIIGNVVGSSLSNAQLLVDLRYKESELRRALHRAVELQEEERKRLARELHDEVGQALTSILIRLKTLQESGNDSLLSDRLDDLRSLTAQTIEELRRLAMDLRPSALDNLGIVPALRWYTQQCAERSGLAIQFQGPEKTERFPPGTELTLYRVAQEGITNAIRHGKAQKIDVIFEQGAQVIRLTITDNGKGFNQTSTNHGLGLVGIRERVELLDGNFNLKTVTGSGTQLLVEIPLKAR